MTFRFSDVQYYTNGIEQSSLFAVALGYVLILSKCGVAQNSYKHALRSR
jgi:hypothetical protein